MHIRKFLSIFLIGLVFAIAGCSSGSSSICFVPQWQEQKLSLAGCEAAMPLLPPNSNVLVISDGRCGVCEGIVRMLEEGAELQGSPERPSWDDPKTPVSPSDSDGLHLLSVWGQT